MATVFEVHCVHADARYAAQAAQAAFELVDRLEQELSRFVENSDISRINHLAAGQGTRVSPWTMECLEIAWHVYGLTGGAFDVSIGSGLERLELDAGRRSPSTRGRKEPASTWAASARATRSIAWRRCWRSGRSPALSSTGDTARSWPWSLPRSRTGGP